MKNEGGVEREREGCKMAARRGRDCKRGKGVGRRRVGCEGRSCKNEEVLKVGKGVWGARGWGGKRGGGRHEGCKRGVVAAIEQRSVGSKR